MNDAIVTIHFLNFSLFFCLNIINIVVVVAVAAVAIVVVVIVQILILYFNNMVNIQTLYKVKVKPKIDLSKTLFVLECSWILNIRNKIKDFNSHFSFTTCITQTTLYSLTVMSQI